MNNLYIEKPIYRKTNHINKLTLIIKKILFYNLFFNLNKKAPDPPKL